ncbi:MAG: T9SS type A sorting domain-containing protein [Bacteroidales bacterium]|nr:T9SS type A sorting domain-containing protein [Bacteroidales bacterium]
MKKLLITIMMIAGFVGSIMAQDVNFTIMKTDGTTATHTMSSDAKIYYSDTQLFLKSNGETVSYDLSSLRKAYFSINDNTNEIENQQLAIYPNPANDVLNINNLSENQLVIIYSINGEIIKEINVLGNAQINIGDLNPGMYIINVGDMFTKFVKM